METPRWKNNKAYTAGKFKVWAGAAEANGWRVYVTKGHDVIFDKGWHSSMKSARMSAALLAKKMR
jgi:hypothetical protein